MIITLNGRQEFPPLADTFLPKVSIVITNFKDTKLIVSCVNSIINCDFSNLEIIIVDCLSPNIEEIIKEKFNDSVKLIKLEYDVGAAEQHNIGFNNCSKNSQYILILDNDTEMDKSAMTILMIIADKNPKIGIFQPKIMSIDNKERILEAGLSSNIFGIPKPIRKVGMDPFFGSGCGMLIRKKILNNIDGYDSKFYLGVDDLDFSWRVRLLGFGIKQVPNAVIYHKMGKTTERLSYRRLYYVFRNTIRMLLKNYAYPLNTLIIALFILRIIEEALVMILFSPFLTHYKSNVAYLAATKLKVSILVTQFIYAILWNIFYMKDTISLHKRVQAIRTIKDREILKRLSKNDLIFMSKSYEGIYKISTSRA